VNGLHAWKVRGWQTTCVLFSALVLPSLVLGCGGDSEAEGSGRRDVVAAFYPLAFAAEQVGGDSVRVTNLTPPGAEPHDVELSVRDVERVRDADLVLYLGSGFQPALEDAAAEAGGTALDLLSGLSLRRGESHGENHGQEYDDGHEEHQGGDEETVDPHVWLDPVRFAAVVRRIGGELDRTVEAEEMARRLEALDRAYEHGLAHCARRELVTSHSAFGYLAERYDLEQIPIAGISPETEPSPRELEHVVETVRAHGARVVFFETLLSPRLAETVAREAGVTTDVLNPIEGLSEHELERGVDYFSVMRTNLAAIRRALGCG
jgi:zinc transport system substrate-binding protein